MKIRSDILKTYLSIHTWTGILAGLLLFIGFFAGALTVFKEPLQQWSTPPSEHMTFIPVEQADSLLNQVLSRYPEAAPNLLLTLDAGSGSPAPVSWSGHAPSHEVDVGVRYHYASLDANGDLLVREQAPGLLAELIDLLHRTGGIPGEIADEYAGGYIMGIAGGMYFLALVSGLIVFLPVLIKDLFALRPGKNLKRFWQDAHNLLGVFSLPFHLIISLTVVVFAFHDLFYGSLGKFIYGEHKMFTPPPKVKHQTINLQPVTHLIAKAKSVAPEFRVTELRYMRLGKPGAVVRLAMENPAYVVRGAHAAYLVLNPYTGEVVNERMLPGRGNVWSSMVDPLFSVHFASYGGTLMRWVYLLAGISGAILFYTGNLLWIEKRRKQANPRQAEPVAVAQRRSVRIMGGLTVGIALGSVAGVGMCMLASKWLPALNAERNAWYFPVYYISFSACVLTALCLGASRAAYWLSTACAVIAAAIPLTSLTGYLFPQSGLWGYAELSIVSVDVAAAFAATGFYWIAMKTRQRAQYGQMHSVWSSKSLV
ncbi:PepSY-associated TM helix domain-containing protein [Undibacterium luofuense]|uniref:PepSY-associated TM helix domain-containing protein n=1 Tax=Undibacterium luofuense TaxID=2828733 RepID=UPI0030EBAA99